MEERQNRGPHSLVLAFPTRGHVNPMLQFSKRLDHKGVRVTIAAFRFLCNTLEFKSTSIAPDSISDGFDDGGIGAAENYNAYVDCFWDVAGPKTFQQLLQKLTISGNSVDCVVHDSFIPWPLEVTKSFGVMGSSFFTQSCAVNSIYYHVYHGNLKIPATDNDKSETSLPALPKLASCDLPSFLCVLGPYPALTHMFWNQFFTIKKVD